MPLSLAGAYLTIVGLSFFISIAEFLFQGGETPWTKITKEVCSQGVGGYVFIWIGWHIAPMYEKNVSIILATIYVLLHILIFAMGAFLGITFMDGLFEGSVNILAYIAAIAGAVVGAIGARNGEMLLEKNEAYF